MCKKNVFLWMFLAVICVIAVSCERDGVYQPKKKISKIYYDYVTGKDLYCTWVWDGNKLKTIIDPRGTELQFYYNGNQIDSVCQVIPDYPAGGNYYKFTYDKKKHHLVAVDRYRYAIGWTESLKSHYEFIYSKDGHVSEMNIEYHSVSPYVKSSELDDDLLVLLTALPQIPQPIFFQLFSDVKQTKGLLDTGHVTFEYEGDNVVRCTHTYGQYVDTYTFAYSHVKNPFYNLLNQSPEWPFPYVTSNQYMLNSLTSLSTLSGEGETYTVAGAADFDYDVEDEYPTRMTYHSRYWQVSPSYPDTSHTTYTYYFEYKN